jgi:uncharacterized iron-regulated membrane protein
MLGYIESLITLYAVCATLYCTVFLGALVYLARRCEVAVKYKSNGHEGAAGWQLLLASASGTLHFSLEMKAVGQAQIPTRRSS